jgi:hypothetical protein
VIRKLFTFAELTSSDVVYHLGCGGSRTVTIAAEEFKVKKSVGIETKEEGKPETDRTIENTNKTEIIIGDIRKISISDATVLLFLNSDPKTVEVMVPRFENELKDGTRIISILYPPDLMLPTKVNFPFFMFQKPFIYAKRLEEQIDVIFGKQCIDFVGSWLMVERYIDELRVVPIQHRRFVNMFQSMVIWINAWNTGVACEKEIPPHVHSYLGILRTFFNIDMSDLISSKRMKRLAGNI